MAVVELKRLGKSFGKVTALEDVELSIPHGRRTVVLGRSGSGKTTLLRLIAGLETPSTGSVIVDGKTMEAVPPHKRNVAMTFQHDALLPHRTVRENVEFPLAMAGVSRDAAQDRARELLGQMQLSELAERSPDSLSGGQRQLAALARALVRRPAVVLMDEPFAHLDTPLRAEIRRQVVAIQRQLEVTMVVVTHDQREAMDLADQLVILHGTTVAFAGDPASAYHQPDSLPVAAFLGDPPLNTVDLANAPTKWQAWAPPDAATLAVRPENLRLEPVQSGGADEHSLECQVLRVQDQGASVYWECQVGGVVLHGAQHNQSPKSLAIEPGATARLVAALDRLLAFDASGRRL